MAYGDSTQIHTADDRNPTRRKELICKIVGDSRLDKCIPQIEPVEWLVVVRIVWNLVVLTGLADEHFRSAVRSALGALLALIPTRLPR